MPHIENLSKSLVPGVHIIAIFQNNFQDHRRPPDCILRVKNRRCTVSEEGD
jgi:hypothetical protein